MVDDADAVRGQPVPGVHPEDHLLQRAAGEAADEQQLHPIEHDASGPKHVHVTVVVDFGLQSRGRDRDHLVAASGERGEQPTRMPGA